MKKTTRLRGTNMLYMLLIAVSAITYQIIMVPAIKINKEHNTYLLSGPVEMRSPFWPQYWRRLRNLPEPDDPAEVVRSDDGGLILMGIIATPIALGLAYKFRKYLIRRV